MHIEVRQLIKRIRKELYWKFRFRKVLEVGSANINGSPRRYFYFCDYTGIDLSAGKGVDIIGRFADTAIELNSYDVVISCEMLEHDETWNYSLMKMYHALKRGGLLIITAASDERQEHGTRRTTPFASPDTLDYYRNISKEDFKSILPAELFDLYVLMNGRDKQDLYFYGIKK